MRSASSGVSQAQKALVRRLPRDRALLGSGQQTKDIAMSLMLPHTVNAVRFSDAYTNVPTALGSPYTIADIDFNSLSPTDTVSQIEEGLFQAFISKNPFQAYITWEKGISSYGFRANFDMQFGVDALTDGLGDPTGTTSYMAFPSGVARMVLEPVNYTEITETALHDGLLFTGTELSHRYTFLQAHTPSESQPGNCFVLLAVRTDIPNYGGPTDFDELSRWTLVAYKVETSSTQGVREVLAGGDYTGTTWSQTEPAIWTANGSADYLGYTHFYVNSTGWYRFEVIPTNEFNTQANVLAPTVSVAFELQFTGGRQFTGAVDSSGAFSIHSMPGYLTHSTLVKDLRVTAATMMFTPDAAAITLGGQAAMRQLPDSSPWWLEIGKTPSQLGSKPDATVITGKKGIFGFMKAQGPKSYQPIAPVSGVPSITSGGFTTYVPDLPSSGGYVYNPIFPIDGFMEMSLKAVKTSTSDSEFQSGTGHLTVCWGIEYTTDDTWVESALPEASPQSWDSASYRIRDARQFHENPLHIRDIMNFLRASGRKAWQVAPAVLKFAEMLSAELAPGMPIAPLFGALNMAHRAADALF